jgi:hypothetical protein
VAGLAGGADIKRQCDGKAQRGMRIILALMVLWSGATSAQNAFVTPGGASVPGIVTMCISNGQAVPCTAGATTSVESFDRILGEIDALRLEVERLKGICAPR